MQLFDTRLLVNRRAHSPFTFALCFLAAATPVLVAAPFKTPQSVAPALRNPPSLHVEGNRLRTAQGRVVRLSGVNIPSLEWSNEGEQVLKSVGVAVDGWGSNCLRLPLSQDRWFGMESGQVGGGAKYRELVDDIVQAAAKKGAYVVLDLHWSNAGAWKVSNSQHKMPDLNSQVFWIDAANRYANNPAVLFDLYNEPRDVSWDVWRNGGDVSEKTDDKSDDKSDREIVYRTPGMQPLLEAIRATGARNIVVASGLDWGYDLSGVADKYALKDSQGDGVMYSTHIYPWEGARAENWDPHVAVAAAKYPVLVGEVGCEPDAKQEDPMTWAPKSLKYIDDRNLNWTAWCFHPSASPRLLLDWHTPTPYWGAFAKIALLNQSAARKANKNSGAPENAANSPENGAKKTGAKKTGVVSPLVPRMSTHASVQVAPGPETQPLLFGALQNDVKNLENNRKAGLQVSIQEVSWDRFEPRAGEFDASYIKEVKNRIARFRAAKNQVMLDLGMQYSPRWIFSLPNSRYRNQYGDEYAPTDAGQNGLNAVWNQAMRDRQAAYFKRVLAEVGSDVQFVRLGWGYYGELNFPDARWNNRENCYWAFDDMAQGKTKGLPQGIASCPVAGWIPGTPGADHKDAARFADWYMNALKNYHDWQIQTARQVFKGRLAMLYPSWGIRPGQLEAAVQGDLNGQTSAEKNGEVQRGFDFARFIAGIRDPKVIVYCTWIDSNPAWSDENSADSARWSPVHYLASLAKANPLHLQTWGENTGRGDRAAMHLTFDRARAFNLMGVMWAFEPDLYDGKHASLHEYSEFIAQADPSIKIAANAPTPKAPTRAPNPVATKPAVFNAQTPLVRDALHARVKAELKRWTDWLKANNARGFIGETGWPDDVKGDAAKWNNLAEDWYRDADAAGLWVTTWSTGEWWGTDYLLAPYENRDKNPGIDTPDTQAAVVEAHLGTRQVLRGVNVSGGEFGGDYSNVMPGIYDQKYHFDPKETFTFLASRGITLVRIPFRWERLQSFLGGPLRASELKRLHEVVANARSAGLQVILDMHNYAAYSHFDVDAGKGVERHIGAPDLSREDLADAWKRISLEFKDDAGVFYGLMNEPVNMPDADGMSGAQSWERASQMALSAIRANGDNKLVMVPGYNWSGAQGWAGTHPKSWIVDPANNFRYEAHHYWDRDNSGDYPDAYDAEVIDAQGKGYKP